MTDYGVARQKKKTEKESRQAPDVGYDLSGREGSPRAACRSSIATVV